MEREDIIRTSMLGRGALIKVADLKEAAEVSNRIAPEHLELSVEDPQAMLDDIRHAGAIFMGRYTAEALGDRKSTRLNSSHVRISYAVFCLKKKNSEHRTCIHLMGTSGFSR